MPEYIYRAEDGRERSVYMRMTDKHPTKILVDKNEKVCKVWEDGTVDSEVGFDGGEVVVYERVFCESTHLSPIAQYPYVSCRLQGQLDPKDAEHVDTVVRGVKQEGLPVIRSKAHEREIMAKYGYDRE